jgi:endogenous inhibitor of DNA gyrase (YacG/DUF329 family)
MNIACPTCKKKTPFEIEKNIFRPFCSERCKLIDLGEWASGKLAIPSDHCDAGAEEKETFEDNDEK